MSIMHTAAGCNVSIYSWKKQIYHIYLFFHVALLQLLRQRPYVLLFELLLLLLLLLLLGSCLVAAAAAAWLVAAAAAW